MTRRRIGLVLLIPEPWRSEVNGLRRAMGDTELDRIPPHITLVPPINLRDDAVLTVLRVMADVTADVQPFEIEMGPVSTFAPESPVVKLDVRSARVTELHERLSVPPLDRPREWPFDAHVTLHPEFVDDVIASALHVLQAYAANVPIDAVVMLEQGDDRVWRRVADARFGKPAVVGTGGLATRLRVATVAHPLVLESLGLGPLGSDHVVIAEREGHTAGVFACAVRGRTEILALRVAADFRGQGVGRQLVSAARHLQKRLDLPPFVDATRCPDAAKALVNFGVV